MKHIALIFILLISTSAIFSQNAEWGGVTRKELKDSSVMIQSRISNLTVGAGITESQVKQIASDTAINLRQFVTGQNYLKTEVDGSITNELQDLSRTGNTLSLSGDASTVDLSPFMDNTDSQDLTIAGNIISLSGDATPVTLPAEVDGSVSNEGSLTVAVGGANDSQIHSNTSGSTDVTISGGTNVTVTEAGSTITIASTAGGSTVGYTLQFVAASSGHTSATTYYFSNVYLAQYTGQGTYQGLIVPKTGAIKSVYIWFKRTNGTYTSGNFIVSIGVSNSFTQIGSVANYTTPQVFSLTGQNIAVTAGQYLEIKVAVPTLSVAGTAAFMSGTVYIE